MNYIAFCELIEQIKERWKGWEYTSSYLGEIKLIFLVNFGYFVLTIIINYYGMGYLFYGESYLGYFRYQDISKTIVRNFQN